MKTYSSLAALCLLATASIGSISATAASFGKPGEPVEMTVGFPCCYAATWSGYVVKEKELWKQHLPEGSVINYNIPIAGPPIVNGMLADKIQVGYLGDMPAIALTTKERVADVRLVATTALAKDQCNILLVREDAPDFAAPDEAVAWLQDKQVAVPRGSCGDHFASAIMKDSGVEPSNYLNQTIEVISSSFRAKKIDAASVWEPVASQLVNSGLARRAASGANFDMTDGAFIAMRQDLIESRPDVVRAWLEAELDAQLFMSDPQNAKEVVQIIHKNVPQFSEQDLHDALYRRYAENQGGNAERLVQPFTFTDEVRELLAEQTTFLHSIKGIAVSQMRPEAIYTDAADEVLARRGLTAPVGRIEGVAQ
ncbi:ABC transporter substrate-binding protein [Stutzerimonas kunmingensis]|uniref:ABC transporter substrate-binding protein n=1 Tax=Stutzerimonas kunmingensis TaxID=1211807 RepID=UPI00241F3806|nr:ABC transporter substrate-binding protein [Stutzerimonas kunmingensis]